MRQVFLTACWRIHEADKELTMMVADGWKVEQTSIVSHHTPNCVHPIGCYHDVRLVALLSRTAE